MADAPKEPKVSPAPWWYDHALGQVIDTNNEVVAWDINHGADGFALAAALDLLAACREALIVIDEAYEATGHFKVAKTSEQRMRLEAAIRKATGQQGA